MAEAKQEPLNKVTAQSYHKDRGGPEAGGGELASDGPIHGTEVKVTPVPDSPAERGVFAGRGSELAVDDSEHDDGQHDAPVARRSHRAKPKHDDAA